MKRNNQKTRLKEPVRLRVKLLSNGNQSLYLDTYFKGKRVYEFLRLYLIPEKTAADRALNVATLQAANAIKATRILAFVNGRADIRIFDSKMSLKEWIEKIIKTKSTKRSKSSVRLMTRLIKHLQRFEPSAELADVDREFCLRFIEYLYLAKSLNSEKLLQQSTQFELQNALSMILNEAVRAELIVCNPMQLLNASDRIRNPQNSREYLTPEEVRSIIKAASKNIEDGDDVAAFLFCCFCGLRYSDVLRLKWKNIVITANGRMVTMIMKKTNRRVDVPLSEMATSILPASGEPDESVFSFLSYGVTLRKLRNLAKKVGIKKK